MWYGSVAAAAANSMQLSISVKYSAIPLICHDWDWNNQKFLIERFSHKLPKSVPMVWRSIFQLKTVALSINCSCQNPEIMITSSELPERPQRFSDGDELVGRRQRAGVVRRRRVALRVGHLQPRQEGQRARHQVLLLQRRCAHFQVGN